MMKILLTGASGQLGRLFCEHLSKKGHRVTGVDMIDQQSFDGQSFIQTDITNEENIRKLFDGEEYYDAVINNAGAGIFTPFEDRTLDELEAVARVNLFAPILIAKQYSLQKEPVSKRIINIASVYGMQSSDKRIYGNSGRNNSEIYSATKAGVIMLTKYLSTYLAEKNILVNSISPGGVFNSQDPDFVCKYKNKTPLNRMARPEDFCPALDFLLDTQNNYTTGINLPVDGGFTSW